MTTYHPTPTSDDTLAPADLDVTLDPARIVLSAHAVQRYRERVDGVPRRLATTRLPRMHSAAYWRSRPLPWTNLVLHPGVVYG